MILNSDLTFPIIHPNGTSAEELRAGYVAATRAVQAAITAVSQCNPNGRDYYPAPESLNRAISEQQKRLNSLAQIASDLRDLAIHCDKFTKD
jgi:hypothetical protein